MGSEFFVISQVGKKSKRENIKKKKDVKKMDKTSRVPKKKRKGRLKNEMLLKKAKRVEERGLQKVT